MLTKASDVIFHMSSIKKFQFPHFFLIIFTSSCGAHHRLSTKGEIFLEYCNTSKLRGGGVHKLPCATVGYELYQEIDVESFLIECRKTKTKMLTLTNHCTSDAYNIMNQSEPETN